MNYLSWASALFQLIENYAALRVQGSVADANLGTLAAGVAILQHLNDHPAVAAPAPQVQPSTPVTTPPAA